MTIDASLNRHLYRWRFGTVEYDEARHELRVAGLVVEMENRPLEVLSLLLRHVGEVVTKEELFEQVWAGRITVDHVLATAVGKLRKALDASGENRIVTMPRIGYRFDGPVERIAVGQQQISALALEAGQPVPGRGHFLLERPLGHTLGSEVWLARHPHSHETRVFKFALDGERLSAIKREATLMRVLRDSLGERDDFVRAIDWNFESPPYFLECGYGGESLPEWAVHEDRMRAMSPDDRITLFLQIADAVAAAHGVGVLHKDLKPANILVAPRSGGWQVRLTDFGNSRLLQPERLAELGITALGMTLTRPTGSDSSGTPLYLAPELVAGQPPTVRSDVYALGVILYQWLVGDLRRPLAPGWERDIDDPLLREDIAQATDFDPARRVAGVAELAGRLRGLPARREARARRETAEQASAELRQALERTRARRPWIIATICVLGLALVVSGLFWHRSETLRRDALQQAARAEAVSRFLSDDLLGALSPGGSGFERDPTVREVLAYASTHLDDRFPHDPATRGSIHAALGQAWRTLGDRERGVEHMRVAVRHYAQSFGEDDTLTLRTRYALVRNLAYANSATHFTEAGELLDATDTTAGARLQELDELALEAAIARGTFHFQQLQIEPALAAWQHADGLQRRLRPDDAMQAALIRHNLADATLRRGEVEAAITQLRGMLADPLLDASRIGETHAASQRILLAHALRNLGRYEEALPLAEAAAEATARILGPDDYSALIQLSTIASIHDFADNCPKALDIMRTVRSRMAARYGENRQATLIETGNLGFKEYDCGDREAGLDYIRRAESGLREQYGADNVAAYSFRFALAQALAEQGRYREALDAANGLDPARITAASSRPGKEQQLRALRGEILIGLGESGEGRPLLATALPELDALGLLDEEESLRLQALLGDTATQP